VQFLHADLQRSERIRDHGRDGHGGSARATATISATPGTITLGQSVTVDWSSTNATSCTSSGAWSGSRSVERYGEFHAELERYGHLYVACSGAGCQRAGQRRVQVNARRTPTATNQRNPGDHHAGAECHPRLVFDECHELYEQRGLERFEERERYGEFHAELERYGHLYGGLQRRRGVSAPASARVQVNPASGHGGGGGLGMGTLLGLGMLLASEYSAACARFWNPRRRSTA